MKRLFAIAVTLVLVTSGAQATSPPAYPGAQGFVEAQQNGGAVPVRTYNPCGQFDPEEGACTADFVMPEESYGPGGWGDWVSDCASANGGFDEEQRTGCVSDELP